MLKNKKQSKFLFIILDKFYLNILPARKDKVYKLTGFLAAPPPSLVGNSMLVVFLTVAEGLNSLERKSIEEVFHTH